MEDPPSRSGPPPIYIQQPPNHFDRARGADGPRPYASAFSPSFASVPKAIPGRYTTEDMTAPPPLPPPRFAPVNSLLEPGSSYNTPHHRRDESEESLRSFRSESSGFGSMDVDPPSFMRKQSDETVKPDRDEGYHSLASTLGSAPQKFFMSHNQYQLRPRENDYDSSLLKKFNAQPPRRSGLSSSANDAAPRHSPSENRLPSLLTSLPAATSLPMRPSQKHPIDSAGPVDSALSPRGGPLMGQASHDYRSPIELGTDRSPVFRTRRQNSGSLPDDATVSTQGSYENADDADFHMDETAGMGRLHLGQKRRASSPPVDEVLAQGLPGTGELLRRREGASRSSPTPRLTVVPHGSMSSISSTGRSGSFASNGSLTATSLASMNSMGRRSPGGFSPGGLSPIDSICNSPFNTPMTLGHSPRSSLSLAPPHHRNLSGDNRPLASPRKLTEVPKSSMARIQGFFMCECCPKKPKKFETAEELSAHEAEKQYECSFCGNRFKNKNEAERHQNSLHVRRHSWSCSALHVAGYDKAFHDSAARPGEFDTCGYCGDEFMRSGPSSTGRNRHITEQDWDERLRHLQEVHKFRECNSSKKFYRADHFRQHLKHSHAGTSGKWTNMLESACMVEEEPPQLR